MFICVQDDEVTNAGKGSNLTASGHVECDASAMDGQTGAFGAVGAVPGKFKVENSIKSNASNVLIVVVGSAGRLNR